MHILTHEPGVKPRKEIKSTEPSLVYVFSTGGLVPLNIGLPVKSVKVSITLL